MARRTHFALFFAPFTALAFRRAPLPPLSINSDRCAPDVVRGLHPRRNIRRCTLHVLGLGFWVAVALHTAVLGK